MANYNSSSRRLGRMNSPLARFLYILLMFDVLGARLIGQRLNLNGISSSEIRYIEHSIVSRVSSKTEVYSKRIVRTVSGSGQASLIIRKVVEGSLCQEVEEVDHGFMNFYGANITEDFFLEFLDSNFPTMNEDSGTTSNDSIVQLRIMDRGGTYGLNGRVGIYTKSGESSDPFIKLFDLYFSDIESHWNPRATNETFVSEGDLVDARPVMLDELVANPTLFQGKRIRVSGRYIHHLSRIVSSRCEGDWPGDSKTFVGVGETSAFYDHTPIRNFDQKEVTIDGVFQMSSIDFELGRPGVVRRVTLVRAGEMGRSECADETRDTQRD